VINHIRQIRKQVPLIPVRQDGRDARVVEFYLVVADFDEVDGRVGGHEGCECRLDDLADGALFVRKGNVSFCAVSAVYRSMNKNLSMGCVERHANKRESVCV